MVSLAQFSTKATWKNNVIDLPIVHSLSKYGTDDVSSGILNVEHIPLGSQHADSSVESRAGYDALLFRVETFVEYNSGRELNKGFFVDTFEESIIRTEDTGVVVEFYGTAACDEGFDYNGSTEYCGLVTQLKKENPSASKDEIMKYVYGCNHRCSALSETFVLVHEADPKSTLSLNISRASYTGADFHLEDMLVGNGYTLNTIHEVNDDDLEQLCEEEVDIVSLENVTSPSGMGYRALYLSYMD